MFPHMSALRAPKASVHVLTYSASWFVLQVLEDERFGRKGEKGRRCSWSLAEALVAEVDLDRDGTVSYEEYRNMWANQEVAAA